jgi:hypothetical protein
MAFSLSNNSTNKKPTRAPITIHAATARDYERCKLAAKHEAKFENDYDILERKMISRAKWNQRAENNNIRLKLTDNAHRQDDSLSSLDAYIQHERNNKSDVHK